MNVIDLIINALTTISNFLRNSSLINWLGNHILLGNIVILIVIALATNGIKDLLINYLNINTYPANGTYGLTRIMENDMISLCNKPQYYEKELNDRYRNRNYSTQNIITYTKLTDKPMKELDTFPAYKWVCQYKVIKRNNSNSELRNDNDVVQNSSVEEIGLSLEKYFCIKDHIGNRAIFLNYEDPYSWYCINDRR